MYCSSMSGTPTRISDNTSRPTSLLSPIAIIAIDEMAYKRTGNLTARISGGKVVEEHNVWDTLKLAQQIGAVGQVGKAQGA